MAGWGSPEQLAAGRVRRTMGQEKRARPLWSGDREVRSNVKWRTGGLNIYVSFDHPCRGLQLAQLEIGSRVPRVDQHTNRRRSRNKLVQKLQTLGLQFRPKQAHACNIA